MSDASSVFRNTFATTVNDFVNQINASSELHQFMLIFMLFLAVLVYVQEVGRFMILGFEPEKIINSTLMVFFTLFVWGSYSEIIDSLIEVADGIGLIFLRLGTGNSDPFFLHKWINHSLKFMLGSELSFWDMTVGDVLYAILWHVAGFVLELCMYFIGSWAMWTIALAKILSILFVPMLMHPATRNMFDAWVKFTLGSIMLLIVVRAAGVLTALGIQAQFKAMGILQCGHLADFASCDWTNKNTHGASFIDFTDTLVTMIVGILLILSSIGLSANLVSNVASPSAAATRGAGIAASKIMKMQGVASLINRFK
ncbi:MULTISPECIES: type IV secretion system protein [unclassified Vibrio]|uniref:type IV secretion system protein n=1 Tax=unclassified Vibrio TaxID=2614977 RepID=UPI000B8E562F|nr:MULTISPECIES: type IV secretion system protein [unclassified Vibrio]NAW91698.1 hypothetical protein [Vibrio sp. V24_P1S3T111]OXX19125.1 hypothetical protein B9J86_16090 [Vibrio sp. V06_P1A73T115]OXX20482.1 hypothetical protein B9J88_13865 [Vibrio sp. V05_P4A8T149]OXX36301.1 hypothetical protein B9J81_06410 [Vibrio sp. V04_P4A5T148]OXX55120.1 hypothetical protein B9J91_10220 [Vibrio sp. V18_P1S4T112]